MKNQDQDRKVFLSPLVAALAIAFAVSVTTRTEAQTPTPKKSNFTLPVAKSESPLDPKKLSEPLPANLFIELSKLVNPAVVSVFTSQTPPAAMGRGRGGRDPMEDLFEQFWGVPRDPREGQGGQQPPQATGLGTGFIVREDGLILTNNHVVAQADIIKVQLDNNSDKFYEAEVLGRDARTDIALIKIDAKRPLPTVQLGSSKDVQVGEWVAAFGNPYGHAHTLTKGIVSAVGRAIPELNRFPFIQTDASINPGNSGGPLVNAKGLVIGVNTAIDARAQGIGFSIPIDDVKRIVSQLEREGRIRRGFLGIGLAPVSPEIAAQLGLESTDGVIVSQVMPKGAAAKAGVKPYDIITEFNNKKVAGPMDLQVAVGDSDVGVKTSMKVIRFENERTKKTLTLNVVLDENPEDIPRVSKRSGTKPPPVGGKSAPHDLGFKVANETPKLRQFYNVSPEAKGPIVIEIDSKGLAAKVGLRAGDVILDVNRQPVSNASDVNSKLVSGKNLIRVARGNSIVLVVIGN
ncbi:DegQ family serine endoprotease [soil metagenome]